MGAHRAGVVTVDAWSGRETTQWADERLLLPDVPEAVRVGRHFVQAALERAGRPEFAADGALIATELLANAREHGAAPITVRVRVADGARIRIEVGDGSRRRPVQIAGSTGNMTGRGLGIVASLANRWGTLPRGQGKVVWAELAAEAPAGADGPQPMLEQAFAEEEAPEREQRHTVVLGDVPTDLLLAAKAHVDNVVRELTLASAGADAERRRLPEYLAELVDGVVRGFADARDAIKRQALAAAKRGEPRTSLVLHLPLKAADAGEAYLRALDETDEYSGAARLLTLEAPPEHRLFRRWYVGEVVAQLRAAAAGDPPPPTTSFEAVLLQAVRHLAAAQEVSERAARLQRVSAALSRARTPEDVADAVVSEGVEALRASGGGLLVPAADGEHLAVPGAVGYGASLVEALRDERLDAPLPEAQALRTGNPVWLESRQERDALFPALRGMEADTMSMCAVPLAIGAETLGALRFSFAERRLFDETERSFVLALAAQTAQTLQRTTAYKIEREAAFGLQRALLPQHLPPVPGWEIATHYSAAGAQEAGGDFYDLIPLPGGRTAAVVGDVMGRGVEAAAAMAQIRSVIAAYAVDDPDPGSVFTRVDAFFRARDLQQLVTAVYVLIEEDDEVVLVANAGHPPPLLADAASSSLFPIGGPPFGLAEKRRFSSPFRVPAGATLVAITDGVVERRGENIDEGFDRVLSAASDAGGVAASALLERILAGAAVGGVADDDVTVLVLRHCAPD